MSKPSDGLFQVSLMNVFRQAVAGGDARKKDVAYTEDEARVLSIRSIERREGADQGTLRDHLAQDLSNLMSTIHLEAAISLDGLDSVRRSVLNYGLQDMSRLTTDDIQSRKLLSEMRDHLVTYEPRLIPDSVEVRLRDTSEDSQQRVAFDVSAEMTAKPVDVPLEFVAEIDVGAGRAGVSNLKVRG